MEPEIEYITVEAAARQLGLHPDSIRRLIRNKELKAYRFGNVYRIKIVDWEQFIKDHATIDDDKKKD